MKKILLYIASLLFLAACVREPSAPEETGTGSSTKGAFVLCEGLLGHDNSTLIKYDQNSDLVEKNFFRNRNKDHYLGDTAFDLALKGDTAYVVVSTPGIIEAFIASTGRSIGRIQLPEGFTPRNIAIVNDSVAYVTNLYDNSVTKFNPSKMEILKERIETGPNPEGIVYYGGYVFVANSALGIFNKDHPKARTIAVIDAATDDVIDYIPSGPNTVELILNKTTQKLYAAYYNTFEEDSLGGIIEYDINSFEQTGHWRLHPYNMALSPGGSELYFLDQPPKGNTPDRWKGLAKICIAGSRKIERLIENAGEYTYWYSLAVSPYDGSVWIGNAKDYQTEGELLVFDGSRLTTKFNTGINPTKIVFY